MLNEQGHEVPDPTPAAIPVGFKAPPSMVEMIRMYVRRELSQQAADNGDDTFEEAEDFDVEDDPIDPHTPFEAVFDPVPEPAPQPASAAGSSAPPLGTPSASASPDTPPAAPAAGG